MREVSTTRLRFLAPIPRLRGTEHAWKQQLHRIEDLGFHAVAISEHYSHGWAMDALTAMNFALAQTSRLHAVPLVLNNDLHHPGVLAKAIATADVLSGGRASVGIGAGWLADDYRALGVELDSAPTRVDRLQEALQVITAFFAGDSVTFQGRHYHLDGLESLPRPAQDLGPPILVGGGGTKMLQLAGRYADIVGLHPQLGPGGLDESAARDLLRTSLDKKIGIVAASSAQAGRSMPQIQFTCYDVNVNGIQVTPARPSFTNYIEAHLQFFADSPAALRGDTSECVDRLQRWHEEFGITYWNLGSDVDAVAPVVARLSAS
jgi:probable F420-dependent oxidoreductase